MTIMRIRFDTEANAARFKEAIAQGRLEGDRDGKLTVLRILVGNGGDGNEDDLHPDDAWRLAERDFGAQKYMMGGV